MQHIKLFHITDVGVPAGNGVDSTLRIIKQYQRLGADAQVISAGNSPFQVAFVGCTDLSSAAVQSAHSALAQAGKTPVLELPIALNSAPRNSKTAYYNAKEDNIYRITIKNKRTFLIYGPEVLKWVLVFCSRQNAVIEKILSVPSVIADTSSGSQFRSAQHLPIVHFLQAENLLDNNSIREFVDADGIEEAFGDRANSILVAPPDEYGNGRLIVDKNLAGRIFQKKTVRISAISRKTFPVHESLTSVVPGILSLWPSSNFFPDPSLVVLNIGTRWKVNTTHTTSTEALQLSKKLGKEIGKKYNVKL